MIQRLLPNLFGWPVSRLVSILEGEFGHMDAVVYWEVFESTGSIEAFLTYYKTEEVSSDSPVDLEELQNKGFEGDE